MTAMARWCAAAWIGWIGVCGGSLAFAASPWVGVWETSDQWGSVYHIVIDRAGSAMSTYGDRWHGSWQEADGGLRIQWENKGQDFIFNGVMGRQRVHTPPPRWGMRGFSSYMKKVDALPPPDEDAKASP